MTKKTLLFKAVFLMGLILPVFANAAGYKPFILANSAGSTVEEATAAVLKKLKTANIQILGQYQPYNDNKAVIIGTTTEKLIKIASRKPKGGFGAVIRISITNNKGNIEVAYVNPEYMGYAYQMGSLAAVTKEYTKALGMVKSFGSKPRTKKELNKFHYMMMMPYFNDHKIAVNVGSQSVALKKITKAMQSRQSDVNEIWRLKVSKSQTIIAIALTKGAWRGKMKDIMQVVDIGTPKSTAALPWEILVENGKLIYLPGKFRVAVMFPDLSMGTFMKISSIPDDMDDTAIELGRLVKKL